MGIHADQGHARFSGTVRCGSVWACAVCSAAIREERRSQLARIVAAWRKVVPGAGFVLLSLTVPHRKGDDVSALVNGVSKAWTAFHRGAPWERQCDRLGIEGYSAAKEVTSGVNGPHPHFHVVLYLSRQWTEADRAGFEAWAYARWATLARNQGLGRPSKAHGVDVRLADDRGEVVAGYLAKDQDQGQGKGRSDLAAEVTRGDMKTARSGSRSLFELLDDPAAFSTWAEIQRAFFGRRFLTHSRRFLARPEMAELLDDVETSDEELADAAGRDLPEVFRVSRKTYGERLAQQPARMASVLDAAEAGDVAWVRALAADGKDEYSREAVAGLDIWCRIDQATGEIEVPQVQEFARNEVRKMADAVATADLDRAVADLLDSRGDGREMHWWEVAGMLADGWDSIPSRWVRDRTGAPSAWVLAQHGGDRDAAASWVASQIDRDGHGGWTMATWQREVDAHLAASG